MEIEKHHKLHPLSTIIILVVLAGVIYFLNVKFSTPYKTLTPENYPPGTQINLYKNIPPGFPRELILESRPLTYSGTVITPEGRTRMTVSYVSTLKMSEILNLYRKTLSGRGWTITIKPASLQLSIIRAVKGEESAMITVAFTKNQGNVLTFQYEK